MPIQILNASAITYAFTLRRTTKPHLANHSTYLLFIQDVFHKNNIMIKEYVFEDTAGLHMHGTIMVPNTLKLKKLRVRGWHLFLQEIFDHISWAKYIHKDQAEELSEDDMPDPPDTDFVIPRRKLF